MTTQQYLDMSPEDIIAQQNSQVKPASQTNGLTTDQYLKMSPEEIVDKQQPSIPKDISTASNIGTQPSASKYNGYCQGFVDDVLQTPPESRAPSASAAWTNYAQSGQAFQGTKGIQPGDLIYFQDPHDPNGHVGIWSGNDKFISATEENPDKPVQNHSLDEWQKKTGQQVLGYVKNPQALPQIQGGSYGSN